MINKTLGPVFIVQFCIFSIIIASTLFQMLTSNEDFVETLKTLFYIFTGVTEIFLYCYFGNELTLKVSEKKRYDFLEQFMAY